MVRALEDKDPTEPLAILAARMPGCAGAELRREAVDIAARHSGRRRAEILKKIAPHLDHQTRIRAFDLVLDIGYGRGKTTRMIPGVALLLRGGAGAGP